jgi:hypothetical protein
MTIPTQVNESVQAHYTRSDLASAILAALEKEGKDLNRLTPEDLAPIDEFHIRGRAATLELAQAANVDSTKRQVNGVRSFIITSLLICEWGQVFHYHITPDIIRPWPDP